jgi:transcriptional regulator with XRE-family HTH domain
MDSMVKHYLKHKTFPIGSATDGKSPATDTESSIGEELRPSFRLPPHGREGLGMKSKVEGPESLADFVRRVRNERGLSLLDVERQSARTGEKIAGSYVSRIENGLSANPSKNKLMALARGLGVSNEELFAVVRGMESAAPTVDVAEMKLLLSFRELPAEAQEYLLITAQALERALAKGERPNLRGHAA